MKVHCQKFIALFLAVVLSVPMFVVPASAANSFVYQPNPSDGNSFRVFFTDVLNGFSGLIGANIDFSGFFTFRFSPHGQVSRSQLEAAVTTYNNLYSQYIRNYGLVGTVLNRMLGNHQAYIAPDIENGIERLAISGSGKWIYDDLGRFPYRSVGVSGDVPSASGTAPNTVPDTAPGTGNKWVLSQMAKWERSNVITFNALSQLAVQLGGKAKTVQVSIPSSVPGIEGRKVWVVGIMGNQDYSIYCNALGHPWVSSGPASPSVVDNDFNIIVDNSKTNSDNIIVDDMKIIDTQNNQLTLLNEFGIKTTYNIDSLYWDNSTHSYTANTYNIVNNTYNYYTWQITYNITNTYINYIGSNAAYQQEEYKYYYELPDGRSSEDLTAEEVGAMSFQFADVKNYARSATDTSLRSLYHFDGNTEDSGYFSTQTAFNWLSGASITYMDSASFNGALYLDETAHRFDIALPSNFGSQDFSIQFRHYQASQPDTLDNKNNSFSIGGTSILTWDERSFYWSGSSTVLAPVPIGNWAELAFVRNSGVLYFYINGLRVASKADTVGYQGKIGFSFGTTSRAYTMLDEFRVVNFAIAKSGASYQCATVPYDTNLVLVLPDSAFPIADEYWEIKYPTNSVKNVDLTLGVPAGFSGGIQSFNGYSLFPSSSSSTVSIPISTSVPSSGKPATGYFSFLLSDGSLVSASYILYRGSYNYLALSNGYMQVTSGSVVAGNFSWGSIGFGVNDSTSLSVSVNVSSGKSLEVIAAAFSFEPILSSGFSAKKISCLYSSEDIKPNTAAVQSEIPVTGYTVGGVRPTFPARGNVWFPVEGRRITGCYIYDGSMWRSAGCRYYTGTRWIPIYAFDIYTLADCWDISDAMDVSPPITSESGFWNWFKTQWLDFRAWLKDAFAGLSGGSGGGETLPPDSTLFPNVPGEDGEENEEGWSIFDIVKGIKDAVWSLLTGVFKTIFGGVASFFFGLVGSTHDFFDAFKGDNGVFGFAKYGGADIWD